MPVRQRVVYACVTLDEDLADDIVILCNGRVLT